MKFKKNFFKILRYAYWIILVWPFWIIIDLLERIRKGIDFFILASIIALDYIQEQIQYIGAYIFKNT